LLIAHVGNEAKKTGLIAGRIIVGRNAFIGSYTVNAAVREIVDCAGKKRV
jgi:hypothetical protein